MQTYFTRQAITSFRSRAGMAQPGKAQDCYPVPFGPGQTSCAL